MQVIVQVATLVPGVTSGAMAVIAVPSSRLLDRWADDAVSASDAMFIVTGAFYSDDAVVEDDYAIDFTFGTRADSVAVSDNASLSIGFIRQFADAVTMSDSQVLGWSRAQADTVSIDDLASVNGQNKPSDVTTMTDASAITFTSGAKADSVTPAESGMLNAQNYYVNGDYFAEDYFGTTRTF